MDGARVLQVLSVKLELLIHLLIELVANTDIVLKVSLSLRLSLLKPHRHEVFVGLRLGAFVSLPLLHRLDLPLQLLYLLFQVVVCEWTVITRIVLALMTYSTVLLIEVRWLHFFKLFVPLKESFHNFLCNEESFLHVISTQISDITLQVFIIANQWLISSKPVAHRPQHLRISTRTKAITPAGIGHGKAVRLSAGSRRSLLARRPLIFVETIGEGLVDSPLLHLIFMLILLLKEVDLCILQLEERSLSRILCHILHFGGAGLVGRSRILVHQVFLLESSCVASWLRIFCHGERLQVVREVGCTSGWATRQKLIIVTRVSVGGRRGQ